MPIVQKIRPIAAAVLAFISVASLEPAQAWTYKALYQFKGGDDGVIPLGGLVRDERTGNLYGTTLFGGAYGGGTIFKVSAAGRETVLYSFSKSTGFEPEAGLVRDGLGNLFGTACCGNNGGIVFQLTPDGAFTVLHAFSGPDGAIPEAALFRDDVTADLYGTTDYGGANNCGTVFRISAEGKFQKLYAFTGGSDGCHPMYSGVVTDSAGNLYGTTNTGGNKNGGGRGVVYKLAPDGTETVLHRFGGDDGKSPYGGVVRNPFGNLYGTAYWGGDKTNFFAGCGVAFTIANGQFSVLHEFTCKEDGGFPHGDLLIGRNGTLYGATDVGGGSAYGIVYDLRRGGIEKVLNDFGGSDGSPAGNLIQDKAGNLYGTTTGEFSQGTYGTVFELVK